MIIPKPITSRMLQATKQVEKADTIMGILNDGKLCLSVNMLIFAFVCVRANKQSSLDTTRY